MPINRILWNPPFRLFRRWLCPTCEIGSLWLDIDTQKVIETGPSRSLHDDDAWGPELIEERFVGLLICQNGLCGEVVAVGGRTHLEPYYDEEGIVDWRKCYEPTFVNPAPPIFEIPRKCPEEIAAELRKAFSQFWSDTGSCANRLRAAAEALLTERRVAKTTTSKKGTRTRLSLHTRIERFKKKAPDAADYLLALKWLGNEGSHANPDELTKDDLLDGFEIFEHVIELVYVKRVARLKKIAQGIKVRKGRPEKVRGDK